MLDILLSRLVVVAAIADVTIVALEVMPELSEEEEPVVPEVALLEDGAVVIGTELSGAELGSGF